MKMRKKISWLLSFFMVFSLFMGSAGMIVKADGQKAVVRIARQEPCIINGIRRLNGQK